MATAGILVTQFDYSKLFIWNNKFRTATYTNSTGSTVNLTKGMLMGRVFSSNNVIQSVSTATDGSQFPIGVLQANYTVLDTESATVSFCISGEIAREGITLGGADTFATILNATGTDSASPPNTLTVKIATVEDYLWSRGLLTVVTTENTIADNA